MKRSERLFAADEKHCRWCDTVKHVDEFYEHPQTRDGRLGKCIQCCKAFALNHRLVNNVSVTEGQRRRHHENRRHSGKAKNEHLRKRHGITLGEYLAMYERQGGACAVCGKVETVFDKRTGDIKALAVDHCHSSGVIRGLLCQRCNHGIGMLGDSAVGVARALAYLLEAEERG